MFRGWERRPYPLVFHAQAVIHSGPQNTRHIPLGDTMWRLNTWNRFTPFAICRNVDNEVRCQLPGVADVHAMISQDKGGKVCEHPVANSRIRFWMLHTMRKPHSCTPFDRGCCTPHEKILRSQHTPSPLDRGFCTLYEDTSYQIYRGCCTL